MRSKDVREGYGRILIPYAVWKGEPSRTREWEWQYVFPAARRTRDPRKGVIQRNHLSIRTVNRRLGDAAALTDIKEIRHQGALGRLSASYILATAVVRCGVRLEAGPPNQRLQTDADLRFASGGAADP